jgi:hypothetical protein
MLAMTNHTCSLIIAYFAKALYSAYSQNEIRTDPDFIGQLQEVWTNSLIIMQGNSILDLELAACLSSTLIYRSMN